MSKFLFMRYHLITGITLKGEEDKIEFIKQGLSEKSVVKSGGNKYKFYHILPIKYNNKEYISGYLVKYKADEEEEIVDEKTMEIIDTKIENIVLGKSLFVIDYKNSLLIFQDISKISKNAFKKYFIELFEKNHNNFFVEISLSYIHEEYAFLKRIEKIKKIKKIQIELFPSNPNFSDRWKRIDERLRKNNISNYKEIQENRNKEKSIIIDEITKSKFYMSEDGYGESIVSGTDENGNEIKITTKESEKIENVEIDKVKEKHIMDIIKEIEKKLQKVIERAR